jgi:hypothetical protein
VKRKNNSSDINGNYDADDQRTGAPVKVAKYGTTAHQASIITKEEIAKAKQDADDNYNKIMTEYRETLRKQSAAEGMPKRDDVKSQ